MLQHSNFLGMARLRLLPRNHDSRIRHYLPLQLRSTERHDLQLLVCRPKAPVLVHQMGSKAEKAVEIKARLKVKVNAGQPVQALRWPAPRTAAAAICPKISRMDKTTTLSRSNSERPRCQNPTPNCKRNSGKSTQGTNQEAKCRLKAVAAK